MTIFRSVVLFLLLPLSSCHAQTLNGAKVVQAGDRTVSVTAPKYSAQFDAQGNLTELKVGGVPALAHRFGEVNKPNFPAPTVNVTNNLVAVRSGAARIEWTFGSDSIGVETEGYSFEMQLEPAPKLLVLSGGKTAPPSIYNGGTTGVVLSNDQTILFFDSQKPGVAFPLHKQNARWLPSSYVNGVSKPGALVKWVLKIGAPLEAAQLLSGLQVLAPTASDAALKAGGNKGQGLMNLPDGKRAVLQTTQDNFGTTPQQIEYEVKIFDHYLPGTKPIHEARKTSTLEGGKDGVVSWQLPPLEPGFYYAEFGAFREGQKLTDSRQTFTVELEKWNHPLTRPGDFVQFWQKQSARLRATPLEAKLELISTPENANKAYALSLAMPDGKRARGVLELPEKKSGAPTLLSAGIESQLQKLTDAARKDGYKPNNDFITLTMELPEAGTFTRWTSAEDNNLLECILVFLRGVDYLATRPDVDNSLIKVFGASRGGPIVAITAAQRPQNICGVQSFINTSAGISWTDKPYLGWGVPPNYNPADPEQLTKLAAMSAYVDPVNHAPDVKCPIMFGYGADDNLSPPQGIEAIYKHASSQWKRISRDAGGHLFSGGTKDLFKALDAQLNAGPSAAMDETILKEH